MQLQTIDEFKTSSYIEIIQEIMKQNNGYVTTKDLEIFDIHRMYLSLMKKRGMIERVAPGIYIDTMVLEDCYYTFSLNISKAIFSHMTALYFHGLSIIAPSEKYDVTINSSYNNPKLKMHDVFYVNNSIYELGLCEVETPMGNKVKAYDVERCICDVIRSRKRMDIEHVKYSIREYLKRKNKNLAKVSFYADKLGIKEEVMDFIGMLYE